MNIACKVGLHKWTDCQQCSSCGKVSRERRHCFRGGVCAACGRREESLYPKLLVVSINPPANIMAVINYDLWVADLYTADIPQDWFDGNVVLIEENPLRSTPDDLLRMASLSWPMECGGTTSLDVRLVQLDGPFQGWVLIAKKPRSVSPDDPRYPPGFFPHEYPLIFETGKKPQDLGDLLSKSGCRYRSSGDGMACWVSVDSHEELARIIQTVTKAKKKTSVSLIAPYICPHGLYTELAGRDCQKCWNES